jgi:hypothetical protein
VEKSPLQKKPSSWKNHPHEKNTLTKKHPHKITALMEKPLVQEKAIATLTKEITFVEKSA